jgi:hypothetical protein
MSNRATVSDELTRAAEEALGGLLADTPTDLRRRIFREAAALVSGRIDRERRRCVEMCRRRAELWRNTTAAKSGTATAREEARARANEAQYLADLLASDTELPVLVPTAN